MRSTDHLTDDLLVRAIDEELSGPEVVLVESHLASCEACRRRHQELRSLSLRVESAVTAFVPSFAEERRALLAQALDRQRNARTSGRRTRIREWRWATALAAALAIGMLLSPLWMRHSASGPAAVHDVQSSSAIEVEGETFVPLPYSNPDLPLTTHIVQMQVPVASLAQAGVILEPISSQVSAPDRSVLADVLLGVDGQPLGVHVIE
ncbi:MAG: zf-HC2 domain-containing protein [Acidobacteriaceae bacterium]|nr:zf-HC2 domain-containing protein [Acidobacteriaceae bacterium]